jgi:2-dehydropantoate 2-reductase
MTFVVVGAGGVGGYFGGKLALNGEEVWFVARGPHLATMQQKGLTIDDSDGAFVIPPGRMVATPDEVGKADVILFCVKSYDTETAASSLSESVTSKSIVVCLQNGVDNEEKIQKILPKAVIFGGAAYIYATITAPGIITRPGGPKRIVFGPMDSEDRGGSAIRDTMLNAGVDVRLTNNVKAALWTKFIFISAVGGITAMTRLTLGEILSVPETRDLLRGAMKETETIARALRVNVQENIIEKMFETLRSMETNTYSSMYHDLVNEKPLEVEAFSGTLVRYGQQLGIPTPIHRTVYAALLPYHLKNLHKRK